MEPRPRPSPHALLWKENPRRAILGITFGICLIASSCAEPSDAPAQMRGVVANDNRIPAGELRDGVLTLRLDAREGVWHPQGEEGPGFEIDAFGEEGGPLQSPAPLIRVPAGTEVVAIVRNTLGRPLSLRGMHDRPGTADSFDVAAGETREVRFRLDAPGTYFYWGRTRDGPAGDRDGVGRFEDGQLAGAIVVDPPGAATDDRVLMISFWRDHRDHDAGVRPFRQTWLVNGQSWPFTDPLDAVVGDSLRLRVIASVGRHPMHLHGFYYRVDARGDALQDTIYTSAQQRLAVTEHMTAGTTMAISWLPKREGHWLFHCHRIDHMSGEQHMLDPEMIVTGEDGVYPEAEARAHERLHADAYQGMAGLLTPILVRDPEGRGLHEDPDVERRRLRVFANEREGYFGDKSAFAYILQEGPEPPAPDSILIPGTPIVLTRDEPVEVTVHNRVSVPITVHWHGLELDSYYDGVAGWSGVGSRLNPAIMPRDSFIVRFTPDRAGTFIYHTHMEEAAQLSAGLYAPLIVLEPGETYDADADRIFLVGWGGPGEDAPPFFNGSADPPPVDLRAGGTYRFRFINITPHSQQNVRLLDGAVPVRWRRLGKDGADLPPHQAIEVVAEQDVDAGETYDFEVTPSSPGELTLEVTTSHQLFGQPPFVMHVPVRIR